MITYINKNKANYYFFTSLFFFLTINKTHASKDYTTVKPLSVKLLADETLDDLNTRNRSGAEHKKNHKKNFWSFFPFLSKHQKTPNTNSEVEKYSNVLFKEQFEANSKKIRANNKMIQKVDTRLKRLINGYNKMVPQGKKFMFI